MDGAVSSRWRRALVISIVMHSLVLTSVGWMAGRVFLPVELQETLIEVDLSSEANNEQETAGFEEHMASSPETVSNLPQLAPRSVLTNETVAAEPIVAVSAMAVESFDNSADVAGSTGGNVGSVPTAGGSDTVGGTGSVSGLGSEKTGGIISPGILSRYEPSYPEQARKAGIEGMVVLRIEILENGRAGDVSVSHSSGSELLDDAAVEAVQRWRFVPAKVKGTGKSIACQTTMPVVFKLRV